MDITMDMDININTSPPKDIAVTSYLYEHHDLLPGRGAGEAAQDTADGLEEEDSGFLF